LSSEPSAGWRLPDLRELWQYRELLSSFIARDLKVRYKQTVLGAAWAILQPLLLMVVFTLFFSHVLRVSSGGVPYPVFAYIGLLVWTYFASTVAKLGSCLVEQQGLMTKVYFPRLVVPLSSLLVGLVDLAVASAVLGLLLAVYRIAPSPTMLAAPLFLAAAVVTALAFGLWLAALNVEYRDVQHLIPFVLQTWFFATPIFYPASLVPERYHVLFWLNPMVGVVEGMRWAVLGNVAAPDREALASIAAVLLVLFGGLLYFRHVEDSFADVV